MPAAKLTEGELSYFLAQPKQFLSHPENARKILGADRASHEHLSDQIAQRLGVDPQSVMFKVGAQAKEYALIVYKTSTALEREHI